MASSPRQVLFRLHLTCFSRQRSSGAAPCCLGPCWEYHIPCWQGCWAVVGLGNCKCSPSAQHRSDVQGGNSGLAALWPPTSLGEQPPTPSLNPCRTYVGCSTSRRSPLPHKQGFAPLSLPSYRAGFPRCHYLCIALSVPEDLQQRGLCKLPGRFQPEHGNRFLPSSSRQTGLFDFPPEGWRGWHGAYRWCQEVFLPRG